MTHILNLQAIVPEEQDTGGDDGLRFDPIAFGSNTSLITCPRSVGSLITCLALD
jgi:hypothetical protein